MGLKLLKWPQKKREGLNFKNYDYPLSHLKRVNYLTTKNISVHCTSELNNNYVSTNIPGRCPFESYQIRCRAPKYIVIK